MPVPGRPRVAWRSRKIPSHGAPFPTAGFARLVERAGAAADTLSSDTPAASLWRTSQHTGRHTKLSPDRFKDFWR
jgi:hypothetical protein